MAAEAPPQGWLTSVRDSGEQRLLDEGGWDGNAAEDYSRRWGTGPVVEQKIVLRLPEVWVVITKEGNWAERETRCETLTAALEHAERKRTTTAAGM